MLKKISIAARVIFFRYQLLHLLVFIHFPYTRTAYPSGGYCMQTISLTSISFQVTNYLQDMAPDLCDRVELHDKGIPLFDLYNIEEEIEGILSKRYGPMSPTFSFLDIFM